MPRRSAKPATPAYLERVALHYIERYPGSTARVRRVLEKRVRRSVEELDTDPAEGAAAVDVVIAKLGRLGYLDDARFAASRARTLRARGKSSRAIRAALARQGIDGELADRAIEAEGGSELDAARELVRRRRMGGERPDEAPEERRARRQKELARLARAGFGFDVARRALDEDPGLDQEP